MSDAPHWWPVRIDAGYIAGLRNDYPDECAGRDDESVREHFNPESEQFQCLWDHIGDAMADYEPLAAAFLRLVEIHGLQASEFKKRDT